MHTVVASLGLLAALALAAAPADAAVRRPGVNAVLGDDSFVARYGRGPDARTPEDVRLRTHLAYVEARLRAREVPGLSRAARAARARNLAHLRAYVRQGVFPRNRAVPGRRPRFVDEAGRLCAVGYLVARTAGRAAADAIGRRYEYAYIDQIVAPEFARWVAASGLTRDELATIQPAYEFVRPHPGPAQPPSPRLQAALAASLERATARLARGCGPYWPAASGPTPEFSARVVVTPDGRVDARVEPPTLDGTFQTCVRRVLVAAAVPASRRFAGQAGVVARSYVLPAAGAGRRRPSAAAVRARLRARMGELLACVPQSLAGSVRGTLQLGVVAASDGTFDLERTALPPATRTEAVARCLAGAVRALRGPAFAGAPVRATLALRLGR